MAAEPIPDFNTAVLQFRTFLHSSGFSPDIVWVCREDTTFRRARMYIRIPLPEANRACAERRYAMGRQLGWGVCLHMLGLLDSRPCCYVWFASSAQEAGNSFCVGLTLKHRIPPLQAQGIRSSILWRAVRCYNKWVGWTGITDSVPSRCEPKPACGRIGTA